VNLNGVVVGERIQCACARGIWAVRAALSGEAPAPRLAQRDGLPEPWANAVWAFWLSREALVFTTICQGAGSVLAFTSVPALVLLLLGVQLVVWIVFLGSQAGALGTPDRAARRAVVGSLAFSFGGIAVGASLALSVALFYGLLAALALSLIGYMYWIAYFQRLGIALRARELSESAVRYTSATILGVLLWLVAATALGDNTPPPRPQFDQFGRELAPVEPKRTNSAANVRVHIVHLALSVWLLVGYTKLIREAESVICERARTGTLPT
jgi:hypothetical protein